jgi:hypothetical protein
MEIKSINIPIVTIYFSICSLPLKKIPIEKAKKSTKNRNRNILKSIFTLYHF